MYSWEVSHLLYSNFQIIHSIWLSHGEEMAFWICFCRRRKKALAIHRLKIVYSAISLRFTQSYFVLNCKKL